MVEALNDAYSTAFTSNLTGILLVDSLVVVLVYSFDSEFEGNIFPYFFELTFYFWTDVWNPRQFL